MNFKRFHESKNLLPFSDKTFTITAYGSNITVTCSGGNLYFSGSVTEISSNYSAWKTNFAFDLEAGTYYCNNPSPLGAGFGRYIKKYSDDTTILGATNYMFTLSETTKCYLSFYISKRNLDTQIKLMLNTGSTPLPYEPYSSEVLHDTPHYIHNTSTDTITTLPAVLYPNAVTATVGLKGQMEQSSTPSPTSPVMPQGTGDKTANLFDKTTLENGIYLAANGNKYGNITNGVRAGVKIKALPNTAYTLSAQSSENVSLRIFEWGNGTFIKQTPKYNISGNISLTVTTDAETTEIAFNIEGVNTQYATSIMLNTGSTALPYEPYGYKIPILSANTTTPVYLGEVEATRKIKKLVLTGQESWNKGNYPPTGGYQFFTAMPADIATNFDWITTHFKNGIGLNGSILNGSAFAIYLSLYPEASILPENATANDFKAWLAAQYAAGTPVTVWYVLAKPTTGIVNEPIRKIGNYADTVSGITIPTIAGANTFSVGTTVQPSEVTVNYKGWHPVADVHEADNGAWT